MVETLECRVLLSSIVVNSTDGGQNYNSTVTANQLNGAQTAVTLRDAINAANNTGGNESISFDPTVFPANAQTPTTIVLSGGTPLELKNTSGVTTISGPGARLVALSGNSASTVFVVDAGVTAEIDGLTITGGKGSVNLSGSLAGGGIFNLGALTLQNDVITANTAGTYGGGLYNAGSGNVTVSGSTFSSDSAQLGGGFFNTGTVSVSGSTFTGDSASSSGGGFYNQSTVTLTNSTLSSDTAAGNGGGFYSNNSVAVSGSTFSADTAGTFGGAFFVASNATVSESTLSQNTAQFGGGFANFGSTTVTASTIAGNFGPTGGGVYNIGSKLVLVSTIVAQNTVSSTSTTTSDWGQSAADSSSSYNLIGDGTSSGLANGVNHNIVGNATSPIDPHLAALADNGGPTETMALLAYSPAINAGSNSLVAGLNTDQRGAGFNRIAGGTVDIGAFEIQSHPPAAPSVNTLISNSTTPVLTGNWDDKNAIVLQVSVNGTTYTLGTNPQLTGNGAGHWKLATSTKIADGTYSVTVHTVNDIGEVTDATATNALVVDTVPPGTPTADTLVTNNNQPVLTGTWDPSNPGGAVVLQVTLNGTTYTLGSSSQLTSDVSGHWTLTTSATIPDGTYSVTVHTADAAGNFADTTVAGALVVDTVPPATPTVTTLVTNNNQPVLSGTWDQGTPGGAVVLQVTLNGMTYTLGSSPQLTSDGSGHWKLTSSATIPDGTYGVSIHTADAAGNVADATVAGALVVDTVPPATPTANTLVTNNNHPVLTGTWDQGTAGGAVVLQVTLNGITYTLGSSPQLTSDGSGHWKLTTSATIPDGKYSVTVHTADAAGNVADATVAGALVVDTVPPATPTVNTLVTNNNQPVLTGTWDQGTPGGAVVLQVTLNGTTYTLGSNPQLTSDGSGHWKLTTSATIPDGKYSVTVHTADAAGNVADATVAGALVVDTVPPATPTVNTLVTNNNQPVLTGTWDQGTPGGAVVLQVTLNGTTYTLGSSPQLTSDGSGHWKLTTSASLADGTYGVSIHTADAAGNIANATVAGALIVDTVPPAAPTVNALVTHASQPILTGTWDQSTPGGAVVLQVTLNGTTYTLGSSPQLTSDGSGHWTLTTSTAIPDGSYSVTVHTADTAGNVADATVPGALIVDTVPPATPTVNSLTTGTATPTITGTWDAAKAVVLQVTISNSATSYTATYTMGSSPQLTTSGGSWSLNLAGTTPLATATYNVLVHTADQYSLTADGTGSVLVINSVQNNLLVTGNANVQIRASDATASYNFEVKFVSGGVQLSGVNGTTFNGQASLVIASVKSLSVQLGNGNDAVRITGTGPAVSLAAGTGQNDVTFRNFTGGKVQVSAAGTLRVHANSSTMSSLSVTGGAAADLFEASKLQVTGNTQLALGGGANSVRIDESQFNNFKLDSSGAGARILIETGAAEGTGTVFNGSTVMQLGGGAQLTFSPLSTSDPTTFNGNLNINAGTPNAKWHRQNVVFAKPPVLHNVTIV